MTNDENLHINFTARFITGALVGLIYGLAVIIRSTEIKKIYLPLFTLYLTTVVAFLCIIVRPTNELISVMFTLIYALLVLVLAQTETREYCNSSLNQVNLSKWFRINGSERNDLRPLIYLTGAKLLTIFCSNLPFVCVAMEFIHSLNGTTNNIPINYLIVLFMTRFVLGTITISVNKNVVKCFSDLSAMCLVMCGANLIAMLLILLHVNNLFSNLIDRILNQQFCTGVCMIIVYISLTLCIDVIGHYSVIIADTHLCFAKKSLSIAYATCVEHLIDILFIVIYLNNLTNSIFIWSTFCCVGLSIGIPTIFYACLCRYQNRYTNIFKFEIL